MDQQERRISDRFAARRPRPVVLAMVALPAVEAILLIAVGWDSAAPIAPQLSAVGPIAALHDLRWLLLVPNSPVTALLAVAGVIALRTGFTIWAVRAFWPRSADAPRQRGTARSVVGAVAISMVVLALPAGLLFGTAIASLSWPVLAGLPAAFLLMAVMAHNSVTPMWWRGLPPAAAVGWLASSVAAMSAASFLILRLPDLASPAVAGLAGLANVVAWQKTVQALAHWEPRHAHPVGIAAIAATVAMALAAVTVGFTLSDGTSNARPALASPELGDEAVLLVAGFESECCAESDEFQDLVQGRVFESYSYAGLDAQRRPLPHEGDATREDLFVLGERMALQVRELYLRTGRPVDIVAESQGTLIVRAYLAGHGDAPLGSVIFLSPIVLSPNVSYPPAGSGDTGYLGGQLLRVLGAMVAIVSPFEADIDQPLARSILRLAREPSDALASRDPVALVPLADSLSGPLPSTPYVTVDVIPALHGGLRGRGDVKEWVAGWLDGRTLVHSSGWRPLAEVLADLTAAWWLPQKR
mgnify:CR=1 FL=1